MTAALVLAGAMAAAPSPRVAADISIASPTQGPVVVVAGTATIASEVDGDVVALAGDVVLEEGAVIRGDVVALGGAIRGDGDVEGRKVSTAAIGFAVGVAEVHAGSRAHAAGMHLLRIGGWLAIVGLVSVLWPFLVRRGGDELAVSPWRTAGVGVLALTVWLVAAVVALAFAASTAGLAVLYLLALAFVAAKVLGVSAVAWWLARALAPRLPAVFRGEAARTGLLLAVVLTVGTAPAIGPIAWVAVNVLGIGAFVASRLRASSLLAALPQLAMR